MGLFRRKKQAEASESVADDALEGASAAQEDEVAAAGEVEEPSTEEAAGDSKPAASTLELFADFRDRFGAEFAAEAAEAGLTLVEAYERHTAKVIGERDELAARLAAHVEAYGGMGADAAVSFDEQSAETVKVTAREDELKKRGVSPGVARFAAGIVIRKEGGKD